MAIAGTMRPATNLTWMNVDGWDGLMVLKQVTYPVAKNGLLNETTSLIRSDGKWYIYLHEFGCSLWDQSVGKKYTIPSGFFYVPLIVLTSIETHVTTVTTLTFRGHDS